jgi:pimeloyl-ACP methyl ester carboxylesterase
LQNLDFREDLTRLEVPFYMVLGEHEARGRAVPAEDWFQILDAPAKDRIVFPSAGHRANFDRPDMFADLMVRVLDETAGREPGN